MTSKVTKAVDKTIRTVSKVASEKQSSVQSIEPVSSFIIN